MDLALFLVCAVVAIAFALVVVFHPDPIRSVLALVVTFFALAVLYVQLSAPLIAALQIIVYTGAILVLFLFVIMLLNAGREHDPGPPTSKFRSLAALVTAGALGGMIASRAWTSTSTGPMGGMTPEKLASDGAVRSVARLLFNQYLFAFEFVSVVLLAALVGAILLTKREKA